jgi:hypothetical protein
VIGALGLVRAQLLNGFAQLQLKGAGGLHGAGRTGFREKIFESYSRT